MNYFDDAAPELEDDLEAWGEEDDEAEEDLEDVSFVCEDCDYRWEDVSAEEVETGTIVCPMCGSVNVTQL